MTSQVSTTSQPKPKKDKQKVLDEAWSDERIKGFLELKPYHEQVSEDFFVLWRAYISMRYDAFERFLTFFIGQGRNLQATDQRGQTLQNILSQHKACQDYMALLQKHT